MFNADTSHTAGIAEEEELSSILLELLDGAGDADTIRKAHDRHRELFFKQ